jgi:hypothetical protein
MQCYTRDEGRPFGAALRGEAPNHLMLRWLKTVVVSDEEKGAREASGGGREGDHCGRIEILQMASKPGCIWDSGKSLAGAR